MGLRLTYLNIAEKRRKGMISTYALNISRPDIVVEHT
jgi:hypothetical protein